jgi:uncharacterized protein (DUF488 family)
VSVLTVGHGRLDRAALGRLLTIAGVETLIDVRRFPGSRNNPDAGKDALTTWLPELGIEYRWDERLGGRRRLQPDEPPVDTWWTVPAFRAYAAYTRTDTFAVAFAGLLAVSRSRAVTIMCSESVWWRCHRRLIADLATLAHEREVHHLMPDARIVPHRLAAGARLDSDGRVVWDGR